jgi:hypothetical protein
MRIDSCRKCGTKLEVNKKCTVCKEANQFFCHSCNHVADEQIHAVCYLAGLEHNLLKTSVA